MRNMRKDIIYPELSYQLTGISLEVKKNLGRFCKEKQYADLFEILLKKNNLNYKRESTANFKINSEIIKGNRIDFIIEDKILIEIKAVPFLTKNDYYQTMRYLRALNLRLGLLINFRSEYLKPKRVLNSSHFSR